VSVNLSYKSLKSCLDQLVASELITIDVEEKRRTVSTTLEGMKAYRFTRKQSPASEDAN
jgi:predicted transcriptional regulator